MAVSPYRHTAFETVFHWAPDADQLDAMSFSFSMQRAFPVNIELPVDHDFIRKAMENARLLGLSQLSPHDRVVALRFRQFRVGIHSRTKCCFHDVADKNEVELIYEIANGGGIHTDQAAREEAEYRAFLTKKSQDRIEEHWSQKKNPPRRITHIASLPEAQPETPKAAPTRRIVSIASL